MEDKPKRPRVKKTETYQPVTDEKPVLSQVAEWLCEKAKDAEALKAYGAIVVISGPDGVRYGAIGANKNDPIVMSAIQYLISKPQDIS